MIIEDVNGTVAFYRDVLGFEVVRTVPARGRYERALLRRGDVQLLFHARTSLPRELRSVPEQAPAGALTLYFGLDEIAASGLDALHARVRAAADVGELRTTGRGTREFSMRDCNGFVLTFAEDEPS